MQTRDLYTEAKALANLCVQEEFQLAPQQILTGTPAHDLWLTVFNDYLKPKRTKKG